MKRFVLFSLCALSICLIMTAVSSAQQCSTPESQSAQFARSASSTPVAYLPGPASIRQASPRQQLDIDTITPEEKDFLVNGPRLYPMDKALELSKTTGKPVVCWMGKHLFANASARKLSKELADTTIQAAMDKDNTEMDRIGFRVKFSSNNYDDNAVTYVTPLKSFDTPGRAERILSLARGGKK